MKTLEPAQVLRALLPGEDDPRLHIVLLTSADSPLPEAMHAKLSAVSWPKGPGLRGRIDAQEVPQLIEWFGVTQLPALLAVCDGALLALEQRCEPEACQRLIALAHAQRQCMGCAGELYPTWQIP